METDEGPTNNVKEFETKNIGMVHKGLRGKS